MSLLIVCTLLHAEAWKRENRTIRFENGTTLLVKDSARPFPSKFWEWLGCTTTSHEDLAEILLNDFMKQQEQMNRYFRTIQCPLQPPPSDWLLRRQTCEW